MSEAVRAADNIGPRSVSNGSDQGVPPTRVAHPTGEYAGGHPAKGLQDAIVHAIDVNAE